MRYIPCREAKKNNANASTVPEAAVRQIYPVFIIEFQTMVVAKLPERGCNYTTGRFSRMTNHALFAVVNLTLKLIPCTLTV